MNGEQTTWLMSHIRQITASNCEVRDFCVSVMGVSWEWDTRDGVKDEDVHKAQASACDDGLVYIMLTDHEGHWIASWAIQGSVYHDHTAAWLACCANRIGYAYWLEAKEF